MSWAGLDDAVMSRQRGVVSRRQLVELGTQPHDIRRMLRRRELTTVHAGVYIDHTGPLSWEQRAWAAVLVHRPAALTRESALADPPPSEPIHVAIGHHRAMKPVADVRTHRTGDLDRRVRWNMSPPRTRIEHAVIDTAAARRDVVDRFRVLADAVQSRRTTAEAIDEALRTRRGVPHRPELLALVADLEAGACSVLEREHLLLERRHGLASTLSPTRQRPDQVRGGRVYRDVDHPGLGVVASSTGGRSTTRQRPGTPTRSVTWSRS